MENKTPVVQPAQQTTVKSFFEQENVKEKFKQMLGKKSVGFVTSVLQIAASNDLLKNADPMSIFNAACVAATLDLPLNNNLGFAYIVPYNLSYQDDNDGQWKKKVVAQFQLGYKGFIQLAQRSGQFKTIAATAITKGQLISENPLLGYEFDFTKGSNDIVVGYASYFKLLNGFEKVLFMRIEDLNKHGGKYSQSFNNSKGLWKTDFDAMATKTVIKLLLSKFAPLSIEMQRAVIVDQALINNEDGSDVSYIDNDQTQKALDIDKERERLELMIADTSTLEDYMKLRKQISEEDYPDLIIQIDDLMAPLIEQGK